MIHYHDSIVDIDNIDVSYNTSYSSNKLFTMINKKGKYAEFKICNGFTNESIKTTIKPLFSFIIFKEGIFTDFTFECCKYRDINENTQIYYFNEKYNGNFHCVSYDSSKLFINLNSNKFIVIHIWDEVFDYPEYDFHIEIIKKNNIYRTIYIDFIDYEWFNSLIYKKENVFDVVKKELNNTDNYSIKQIEENIDYDNCYLIIFDKCPLLQRKKNNEIQKYKVNNLIEMITTGENKYPYEIIKKYLQPDLCKWIKDETKTEKNIENTLFLKFMPFFLERLGDDFKKIYSISNELKINYIKIEIISIYKKKGTFIAFIPLNNSKINNIELKMGDLFLISSYTDIHLEDNNYIAIYIDVVL